MIRCSCGGSSFMVAARTDKGLRASTNARVDFAEGLYERVSGISNAPAIFPIRSTHSPALLYLTSLWTLHSKYCGMSLHSDLCRILCSTVYRPLLRDSPLLMNSVLWGSLALSLWAVTLIVTPRLRPLLKFVWHCFLRPIGVSDQRTRLDKVRRFILLPSPVHSCSR